MQIALQHKWRPVASRLCGLMTTAGQPGAVVAGNSVDDCEALLCQPLLCDPLLGDPLEFDELCATNCGTGGAVIMYERCDAPETSNIVRIGVSR